MTDQISDPITGLAFCNKHINKIEAGIAKAQEEGDWKTVAKLEGHLLGWTEIAEKFLHQIHQQGLKSEDITKFIQKTKKGRFNAFEGDNEGTQGRS